MNSKLFSDKILLHDIKTKSTLKQKKKITWSPLSFSAWLHQSDDIVDRVCPSCWARE